MVEMEELEELIKRSIDAVTTEVRETLETAEKGMRLRQYLDDYVEVLRTGILEFPRLYREEIAFDNIPGSPLIKCKLDGEVVDKCWLKVTVPGNVPKSFRLIWSSKRDTTVMLLETWHGPEIILSMRRVLVLMSIVLTESPTKLPMLYSKLLFEHVFSEYREFVADVAKIINKVSKDVVCGVESRL